MGKVWVRRTGERFGLDNPSRVRKLNPEFSDPMMAAKLSGSLRPVVVETPVKSKTLVVESENSEGDEEFSLLQQKLIKSNEVQQKRKEKMSRLVEEVNSSEEEEEAQPKKSKRDIPPVT